MIKKYRKKPIEVEAIQWTGNNYKEINEFTKDNSFFREFPSENNKVLYISTLEGDMRAHVGDYILKGIEGEFYPCRQDIFESTYEEC